MDLSWRYDLKNLLFRNKTFLFFKIESWNFQHLFEIEFRETSQNFNSFSLFRKLLFSFFLWVVWLSWNFVRFHKIQFQTDAESFSVLSWKTKKFIPKKEIREISKSFNSIRQPIEKMKITMVWISWISWNFVRFQEIQFQTDTESFSFLSLKTKKFYF